MSFEKPTIGFSGNVHLKSISKVTIFNKNSNLNNFTSSLKNPFIHNLQSLQYLTNKRWPNETRKWQGFRTHAPIDCSITKSCLLRKWERGVQEKLQNSDGDNGLLAGTHSTSRISFSGSAKDKSSFCSLGSFYFYCKNYSHMKILYSNVIRCR